MNAWEIVIKASLGKLPLPKLPNVLILKRLELAKQGVEKAIEEGETVATIWLEQELKTLGVSLST